MSSVCEVIRRSSGWSWSHSKSSECLQLNGCVNKLRTKLDDLTKEKVILVQGFECARRKEETSSKDLELSQQQLTELQSTLVNIGANKDRLEREVGDFKWQLHKLKKDLEIQVAAMNELQLQLESTSAVLSR
jgi:chromosome segregation ATPase